MEGTLREMLEKGSNRGKNISSLTTEFQSVIKTCLGKVPLRVIQR